MGSYRKKSRDTARAGRGVPFGTKATGEQLERAFVVGLDVRSRRGKGTVPAQAAAAREAATQSEMANSTAAEPAVAQKVPPRGNAKPNIPEFDAEESPKGLKATKVRRLVPAR